MGVELAFFAHLNDSALLKDATYKIPYTIPPLVQGDTVRLSIGIVSDNLSAGEGSLSELNISGFSCKVAIGVEGVTPITSVTLSPNGDDTRLEGNLPMNTAAIDTLFSGSETSTFNRTFELEFTDGTGTQTIKRTVTLYGELITSTTVATPSPDTAIGKSEAANLYLAKAGVNGFVLLDQNGSNNLYVWNDNGNLRTDPM